MERQLDYWMMELLLRLAGQYEPQLFHEKATAGGLKRAAKLVEEERHKRMPDAASVAIAKRILVAFCDGLTADKIVAQIGNGWASKSRCQSVIREATRDLLQEQPDLAFDDERFEEEAIPKSSTRHRQNLGRALASGWEPTWRGLPKNGDYAHLKPGSTGEGG